MFGIVGGRAKGGFWIVEKDVPTTWRILGFISSYMHVAEKAPAVACPQKADAAARRNRGQPVA